MADLIKRLAVSLLPEWALFWARWLWYPHLLRRLKPVQWPPFGIAQKLVQAGDTVIDVGANIGFVSLLLSELVGPSGRVVAVEPVPYTFRLLRHNMRRLGIHNVTAINAAAGAHHGKGRMLVPRYTTGHRNIYESRLVVPSNECRRNVVTVEVVTLDRLIETIPITGRLSLIKVDVEGAEVSVVEGARGTIRRHAPAMIIETSGRPQQADTNLGKLCGLLSGLHYRPWRFQGTTLSPLGDEETVSGDLVFLPEDFRPFSSPL